MTFVLADRVRETSTTTGTGGYTLLGAVDGFRTFLSAVADGNTCTYVATMGTQWEVGLGTVSTTGPTLSRDNIRASSSGGGIVNWTAGTKDIRLDADAAYLTGNKPVLLGPTATTSGTTFSVTGISSQATKIEIFLDGVSLSGTSNLILRIGDSGGIETTGYLSRGMVVGDAGVPSAITSTSKFTLSTVSAASTRTGTLILDRISAVTHLWAFTGLINTADAAVTSSGTKTLSAALNQYQFTTDGGTDTFDAGAISTRIWT